MTKKIICPTDFSEEAVNATEYAAQLAQSINAELLLVNVQSVPITSGVMLASGIIADTFESSHDAYDLLEKTCLELKKKYNVRAAYEVEVTSQSLTKILSSIAKENAIIVMGAKSSQRLKDFFFGTGTYTIIRKTNCPVLFVPLNCTYKPYKDVTYAMGYAEKSRNALDMFYDFIKVFNPNITILHISNHPSGIGKDLFRAESREIKEHFAGKQEFNFTQLYYQDITKAITTYAEKNPTDLIVMAVRHRNVFESLFHKKPLLSEISRAPSVPVLVFHS